MTKQKQFRRISKETSDCMYYYKEELINQIVPDQPDPAAVYY
ncbi:hypothetical protein [Paenibacillus pectinilyticus]|nr:hypothetical protein [Paenibacillus pectinilyticus]